jgi:LysR family transcriptional regulator, transcriptional activator of nhaA
MVDGSPDWLNYQHLFYFWHVSREGSIARACEKLHLAQPTISIQIQKLERALGAKLFTRTGRRLVLTETGQMVYRYAEEIFALGRELTDVVKGRRADRPLRLIVGVPDVLPKLAVYRLLRPALEMDEEVRLVVHEGKLDQLLAELAIHHLDVVLADAPCTAATHIRAFNHLLGDCGVTVFGTKDLARRYAPDFPASLDGAPMLLPTENTSMRRSLEQWFYEQKIHPRITHEVEDSALLKVFGQAGQGIFCAPTAVEEEVQTRYDVQVVGRLDAVRERFYAISVERRLKHPAVLAISHAARQELFAP